MLKILKYSIILGFINCYIINLNLDPPDTSWTEVQVMGGVGSRGMVSRDCEGNILSAASVPFIDAGVSIDHNFNSFRAGAKAGVFQSFEKVYDYRTEYFGYSGSYQEEITYYVNPNIGLNTKYFGLDGGAVFFLNKDTSTVLSSSKIVTLPSASLRIGNLNSWYFSANFLNSLPLVSGGGVFDMGLGFNLGQPYSNLWLGLGLVPSDILANLVAKVDIPVSDDIILNFRGRYGSGKAADYGLAAGAKIKF